MAKKSAKPAATPKKPVPKYFTREALEDCKRSGSVLGSFGYQIRGRKPKPKSNTNSNKTKSVDHDTQYGSNDGTGGSKSRVVDSNTRNRAAPVAMAPGIAEKMGGSTTNRGRSNQRGTKEADFRRLKEAVVEAIKVLKHGGAGTVQAIATGKLVPRSTLDVMVPKFEAAAAQFGIPVDELDMKSVFPHSYRGGHKTALLQPDELELLTGVISYRDHNNNGMPRDEIVSLIMEMIVRLQGHRSGREDCQT